MNKLLALILVSSLIPSAFARHAYRSEVCTSTTHQITYDGNYPVGGYFSIGKKEDVNRENRVVLIEENQDEYSDEEIKTTGHFETVKSVKIWFDQHKDDGCFEYNTYRSIKKIKFTNLKVEEESILGIKNGSTKLFKCEETYTVPSGDDC